MIIITDTELEAVLKRNLQKNLVFRINNKKWKAGRFLLFKQSGFYIEFILQNSNKERERFEIPIPFEFEYDKQDLVFNYTLTSLVGDSRLDLVNILRKMKVQGRNKFFDNTLRIMVE